MPQDVSMLAGRIPRQVGLNSMSQWSRGLSQGQTRRGVAQVPQEQERRGRAAPGSGVEVCWLAFLTRKGPDCDMARMPRRPAYREVLQIRARIYPAASSSDKFFAEGFMSVRLLAHLGLVSPSRRSISKAPADARLRARKRRLGSAPDCGSRRQVHVAPGGRSNCSIRYGGRDAGQGSIYFRCSHARRRSFPVVRRDNGEDRYRHGQMAIGHLLRPGTFMFDRDGFISITPRHRGLATDL